MKKNADRPEGAPSSCVIQAEDLWFAFDDRSFILQGVDLTVKRGTVTMVLGRSGNGKTTLLKVLAGLLKPQKGSIAPCGPSASPTFSGHRIAYIPQALGLVRSMTALENTLVGALGSVGTLRSVFRWFPSKTVKQAKATLASLGLHEKWDKNVSQLSGGERQRVAIARALMQKPELILADEFVSQLDPITADEILHMTRKLAARGVSFLITAHDLSIVEHYADDFFVLRNGKVAHSGAVSTFNAQDVKRLMQS